MAPKLTIENISIEKANDSDWDLILKLLEETRLTFWFSGNESYKNFYIVRDKSAGSFACCFAIDTEEKTGILKSFAIRKDLQGKGFGKNIVSRLSDIMKKTGLNKLYACSYEAPDFWRKTIFSEININSVKDNFYLNYVNNLKTYHSQYYPEIVHFLLESKV